MTEAERQQVIDALEAVNTERICDDVHHAKRDQHQFGEPCPVVQRVAAALAIMRREREPEPTSLEEMRKILNGS